MLDLLMFLLKKSSVLRSNIKFDFTQFVLEKV